MTLDDFYLEIQQEILGKSEATQSFSEIVFGDEMADRLIESGEINAFDACPHKARGMRVDGYEIEEVDGTLNLFVIEYRTDIAYTSLTKTQVETAFKRLETFFLKSLDRGFYEALEESSYGFKLAHEIHVRKNDINVVNLYLLSNAELSSTAELPSPKEFDGRQVRFHIWDLSRFHRMEIEGRGREDIVIELKNDFDSPLPCLPAHVESADYEAYLAVVPGKLLADIYGKHGQKLLEQNVRTFLQFRGKVNKGIRTTIANEPEMFFAYNNGITATAESVEVENGYILRIHNLQIVNGGQTTASILGVSRSSEPDLSRVFVQMKLSVIEPKRAETVVPNISRWANTQNKVSDADFFSNHPFHVRIEDFSRRIWAPASGDTQRQTHWFYERARGQYLDAQSRMTAAEKRQFKLQNPRNQMFTKTDLAKFEMTWNQLPNIVSLGAQKNFKEFAGRTDKKWQEDELWFNEQHFRELVVKAILFRRTEKLVMEQSWYQGGYRANVVTYSLAILSRNIGAAFKSLNFTQIWKQQTLTDNCEYQITLIAEQVHEIIQDTPPNVSNVTEWCKRELCWKNIQRISEELDEDFEAELIGIEVKHARVVDAKKVQKIDNGIAAQTKVINLGAATWKRLASWNDEENNFTPKEQSVLHIATRIPHQIPNDKQSVVLLSLLDRALDEGFYVGY